MTERAGFTFIVFVFAGVRMLDVAGVTETLSERDEAGTPTVSIVSLDGEDVKASNGFRVPVDHAALRLESVDTLLVPSSNLFPEWPVPESLAAATKSLALRARRVAAIGAGAFVLGAAGLLNNRRATTDHQFVGELNRRYPLGTIRAGQSVVKDGSLFTSSGPSAGIEITRALLRDDGTIRYSPLDGVIAALAENPAYHHTVESLAGVANVSTRTLSRLFLAEFGVTPAKYVELMRIDVAKAFLDAGHTITRTAEESGFGTSQNLRRAFQSHSEPPPSAYKKRVESRT
jgi:transcriptional regulator GlxA family with amidase domain